jgi:hypothetical protein
MRVRRTAEHSGDIQNIAAFAAEHGLRVVSRAGAAASPPFRFGGAIRGRVPYRPRDVRRRAG